MHPNRVRARALAGAAVAAVSLTVVSSAWAHAEISPPETKSKTLQLFTLAVPTEKEGLTTTKIELTPAERLRHRLVRLRDGLEAPAAADGLGRERRHPEDHVDRRQRSDRRGRDLPVPRQPGLQQDLHVRGAADVLGRLGRGLEWPESSDTPAPRIEAKSSLGGGGSSTLAIIALVVGGIGVLLGGVALATRGGSRPVA